MNAMWKKEIHNAGTYHTPYFPSSGTHMLDPLTLLFG